MAAQRRWIVGGSTGLVGSALCAAAEARGIEVLRLVRPSTRRLKAHTIHWDPASGTIDAAALEGADAVIHLGGVGVFSGRWTEQRRRAILDSRVDSTALLAQTLASLDKPPASFIVASATGYYGQCGDDVVTEDNSRGEGFLADVCGAWEAAAQPAREAEIRVVHSRFGIVLSPLGGALQLMLPAFKMGVGGKLGSGEQYMSWVTLDDVVASLLWLADRTEPSGPVNITAPAPVTNAEFTKTLGKVLSRPTLFRVPGFAAKLALGGDLAKEMLLEGQRVMPQRLLDAGYEFKHPELQVALTQLLKG